MGNLGVWGELGGRGEWSECGELGQSGKWGDFVYGLNWENGVNVGEIVSHLPGGHLPPPKFGHLPPPNSDIYHPPKPNICQEDK